MRSFWITNFLLFQACWFCSAFLNGYADSITPLLLIVHFILTPSPRKDAYLLLLLPIGLMVDAFQIYAGLFSVGSDFLPIWLVVLWSMFIVSFNHSLKWLDNLSVFLLVIVGAIGGASSYWGGMKVGVIEPLQSSGIVTLSLMLAWAFVLPTLTILKRHVNRLSA